ncbi:CoA transferase [Zavarzinia sp. CC-PAN008]|uniref:CaiB/BaiF CoA-transferase family protein n=1 Tax=Zavarzinia sp. CC-PAN008 TaxID=3243332 RepID=UPI003F749C14
MSGSNETAAGQTPAREAALAGLKVIELSGGIAARYCGRLLAGFGADVVRIGSAASGDRDIGLGGDAGEAFGAWLDAGKRQAPDADTALALLGGSAGLIVAGPDADALAKGEAVRDALAARLGERAPLYLALSWFNPDGPYARWKGNDALIQALTGAAFSFGTFDGPPVLAQGHAPQMLAGATGFIAGLAALVGRRRGAPGARVDVHVHEAAQCVMEPGAVAALMPEVKATRIGINRFAAVYPATIYRASDGWIGVTALTPAQWQSLGVLVGRPDMAADPRFTTSLDRQVLADAIDAILQPILETKPAAHWLMEGQRLRIPMAPVPQPAELPGIAHWRERGSFAPVATPAGTLSGPTLPVRLRGHCLRGTRGEGPAEAGVRAAPLSGVRVIDFSMGWAGPLAARHFGDLGAEVIKIESRDHPDWWRGWDAPVDIVPPPTELQPHFNGMNRNKKGIALDLARPEGVARAKELVATADVVIENYAPGVMERLGLGPDVLQALRPGLVMVAMGAFGQTGPWSHFRAYGSTVEQSSGLPWINGPADWQPAMQHIAYGDPVAGVYGAVSAMAGLYGRETLGGVSMDMSQVEALFQLGAHAILGAQVLGGTVPRTGNARAGGSLAPSCVVRAKGDDAWLAVVGDAASWPALCRILGRDDWAGDFARATAPEVEAAIAAWARGRPAGEAAAELQAAGVPAAPVVAAHDLKDDPQLAAAGFWVTLERPWAGLHLLGVPPYRLDGVRPALRCPTPTLGQHSDEILEDLQRRLADLALAS